MTRINLAVPAQTSGPIRSQLDEINSAFGVVPNMFRAVGNSEAALASMWGSFGALGSGRVSARLGEEIAVAIANYNKCEYCLAAHTVLGQKAGATATEMSAAQEGRSSIPQSQAALTFALDVVANRGQVETSSVQSLRDAGFDDGEIVEIVAHIALNLFTNYINVALDVPVDFPSVKLKSAA